MAVIGCDAAADKVTIWNPSGNILEPKGTVPNDGYKTFNGVFSRFHPFLLPISTWKTASLPSQQMNDAGKICSEKAIRIDFA